MLDFSQLKEFNPALIYTFQPEGSVHHEVGTPEYPIFMMDQYHDIFNGYLFAQNSILAEIRKSGIHQITPTQLLKWLDEINLRMAHTITSELKGAPGEYAKSALILWHNRNEEGFKNLVAAYFAGASKELLRNMAQHFQFDETKAFQFLKLLKNAYDDKSITLPKEQISIIDSVNGTSPVGLACNKLIAKLHADKYSVEEVKLIDYFIKISLPYPKMKAAMQKYAEELTDAWKKCDTNNLEEIAKLCRNAFFGILDTHPYVNGNTRTATCLIQIILRSFNKPSILLRQDEEHEDPKSAYSLAFKHLYDKPELLIEHIKSRVLEAQKGEYKNALRENIIQERIKNAELIKIVKKDFPSFNHHQFYVETLNNIEKNPMMIMDFLVKNPDVEIDPTSKSLPAPFILHIVKIGNEKYESLYAKLQSEKKAIITPVVLKEYSKQDIDNIISKLVSITGTNGWKAYKKNGLTILFDITDQTIETDLVDKLKSTKAVDIKSMKHAGTEKRVLQIENIQTEKLLQVPVQNSTIMKKMA